MLFYGGYTCFGMSLAGFSTKRCIPKAKASVSQSCVQNYKQKHDPYWHVLLAAASCIHVLLCTTKYSCLLLASCVVVPEEKYKEIVVKSKLNDNG